MDLNSFVGTGRLTDNAVLKTLASGKKLITCPVAINTGYGDYKKTLFIKLQQWGSKGENLVPYLIKGSLVGFTGEMSMSSWTGRDGITRTDLVVDTFNIQLIGSKLSSEEAQPEETVSTEETPVF